MLNTVTRAYRRFRRVKLAEQSLLLAEDRLQQAVFWVNSRARQRALGEFQALETLEQHFAFANRYFGAHQRKQEILPLLAWLSEMKPRRVCEIGMAQGGTTYLLGQALRSVEHLIGIDVLVRRRRRLRFFSRPGQRIDLVQGSSYARETTERVRGCLDGAKLDVLFIDGDHTFAGVAADFAAYRELVRDGGIIAFHDIVEDHTTRFGSRTAAWAGEVPRFWRSIKHDYQTREFVESYDQDGCGIGVLRYERAAAQRRMAT